MRASARHPLPIDERLAAAIILALDQGLYRQRRLDPEDVQKTAVADTVELLFRAAVAPARSNDPA